MSEKLQIWAEIKKQAPSIIKAGGNPVDLLLWSQGKTLSIINFQKSTIIIFNMSRAGTEKTN